MYKSAGKSIDLWSEHLQNNPGSFSTTASQDSDDWRTTASIGVTPARGGQSGTTVHATDTTAYATQPSQESWWHRTIGSHTSPAGISAGRAAASGSFETGSLT